MLVLSRKKNESIVIDGEIVVTIVDIRTDKVRLGIQTPHGSTVHRQEVCEALDMAQNPRKLPWPGEPKHKDDGTDVLDRLAKRLSETTGNRVSREMVSGAIQEAVEVMEESLGNATSLEDLKQHLVRRRH